MAPHNLHEAILPPAAEEQIAALLRRGSLRIERIVSHGHCSPPGFWYDQEEHEWVLLVQGAARLQYENATEVLLKAGDWLEIPAHQRHRVAWTDPARPTLWLAVFWR